LAERIDCETVVDDIEASQLAPGFGAIVVVLVLEHVDYRRALRSLARLAPEHLIVVIQENPPEITTAVTPGRPLPASLRVDENAQPRLIPSGDLIAELAQNGFVLQNRRDRPVADGKTMIGLLIRIERT
jgi:hypothetical protein